MWLQMRLPYFCAFHLSPIFESSLFFSPEVSIHSFTLLLFHLLQSSLSGGGEHVEGDAIDDEFRDDAGRQTHLQPMREITVRRCLFACWERGGLKREWTYE